MQFHFIHKFRFFIIFIFAFILGCSITNPYSRMGSLPYPGLFTLYSLADTSFFFTEPSLNSNFRNVESPDRGIIYTFRAGFLDMAHIHNTINLFLDLHRKVSAAIENEDNEVFLIKRDETIFRLYLDYPEFWKDMDTQKVKEVKKILAIKCTKNITFDIMTWHEIITWFDYRSTVFWSEKPSSFTYEDSISHLIGIDIASGIVDKYATPSRYIIDTHLKKELLRLNILTSTETDQVVESAKNILWSEKNGAKRMLINNEDYLKAWLVSDLPIGNKPSGHFRLPTIGQIMGHDYSNAISLNIFPSENIKQLLKNNLGNIKTIIPKNHYPVLLEAIQFKMKTQIDPDIINPLPNKHSKD